MADRVRFAKGEKVLCFHGPLLHHATCLNRKIQDNGGMSGYLQPEYTNVMKLISGKKKNWKRNIRRIPKLRKVGEGCPYAEALTFALLGTTIKMPRLAEMGLKEPE